MDCGVVWGRAVVRGRAADVVNVRGRVGWGVWILQGGEGRGDGMTYQQSVIGPGCVSALAEKAWKRCGVYA